MIFVSGCFSTLYQYWIGVKAVVLTEVNPVLCIHHVVLRFWGVKFRLKHDFRHPEPGFELKNIQLV